MTTIVYLGDRMISDTRGSIQEKGFNTPNGETSLINDNISKFVVLNGNYPWDDRLQMSVMGVAGNLQSKDRLTKFLSRLRFPLEQLLLSLDRSSGSLYNLIGLTTHTSAIICMDDGSSLTLSISKNNFRYCIPDRRVKACGSGAYYFEATKEIFAIDPIDLFRIATSVDRHSSKNQFTESVYDTVDKEWVTNDFFLEFDKPLELEVLVNGFHPNIRAMFTSVLVDNEKSDTKKT